MSRLHPVHTQKIARQKITRIVAIPALFLGILAFFSSPSQARADALNDDLAEHWQSQDRAAFSGKRVFTSARRFEIALNLGVIPTDDFYTYFPVALDVHYRFTEMWGLMLRGTLLMLHADSTLSDFMDAHQSSVASQYLAEEQRGDIGLMATFHPVYGKWTVGTSDLGRFDWGIFAGIGAVFSKSPDKSGLRREFSVYPEGIFGMDAHIFFLDWLALRLEASMRFYKATTRWIVPGELSLGVSFFLPEL